MVLTLSAILVLLILSGFFSGSETALTAASRPLMHELEKHGNHRASLVARLTAKRERLIGAILLGNNLVNILASALATSVLITWFGEAGVVYATVAMTFLVLVFAEILPKTFAIRHANRVALSVAPAMGPFVAGLAPIIKGLHWIVSLTLRLFGADRPSEHDTETRLAELKGAIDLHRGENLKAERAMLRSVLELADVAVDEIMIHRGKAFTINVDLPAPEIVNQVMESPYTRIPLWRDKPDNIIGVLHAKDLLPAIKALGGKLDKLDVEALASKPWFIPESTSLLGQLQAFRSRREHFALVVDEYGSLLGVVTLEDILEEIVGDISDEHDVTSTGIRKQRNGSYIVVGSVTIRDLNRRFEWQLPDHEAATIAGLVLHETRCIPEPGRVFLIHGLRVEILRREGNQITAVRIFPPPRIPTSTRK